jgi:hypothetical protein
MFIYSSDMFVHSSDPFVHIRCLTGCIGTPCGVHLSVSNKCILGTFVCMDTP